MPCGLCCEVTASNNRWARSCGRAAAWLAAVELPTQQIALQRDVGVEELEHLETQIKRVEKELNAIAEEHAGVYLLRTIPGVGPRTAVGPETARSGLGGNQRRRGTAKRTNPANMSGNSIQTTWDTLHGSRRLVPVRNDTDTPAHDQTSHTCRQRYGVVSHCDASQRRKSVGRASSGRGVFAHVSLRERL